jgi:hypothetical protein
LNKNKKDFKYQHALDTDDDEDDYIDESDEEGEDEEEYEREAKLEDVRMSNSAYRQIKIGESISVIFSILGILTGICSSEMRYYNIDDKMKDDIMMLNYINVFATICLWGSIWSNFQLFVRWKRSRTIFNDDDTLFNTGLIKNVIVEMLIGMV